MNYEIWGIEPGAGSDKQCLVSFPAENFKDANDAIKMCQETIESFTRRGDSELEVRIRFP